MNELLKLDLNTLYLTFPFSFPATSNTNIAAILITLARHTAWNPNILHIKVLEQQANVTKFLYLCKEEQTYIILEIAERYVTLYFYT
jgi:hypothetical protein